MAFGLACKSSRSTAVGDGSSVGDGAGAASHAASNATNPTKQIALTCIMVAE